MRTLYARLAQTIENAKKTGKIAAAQQWQALAEKYNRLKPQLKTLERDRDNASPDGQALIDTLGKRVPDKIRALIERSGDAYNQVGEFKKALPIFTSVYQEIPEDKRIKDKIAACEAKVSQGQPTPAGAKGSPRGGR